MRSAPRFWLVAAADFVVGFFSFVRSVLCSREHIGNAAPMLLEQLLSGLGQLWDAWPPEIHLRTRSKPEVAQEQMRQRLTELLWSHGTVFKCYIASRREAERIDLHDRRLIFQADAANPKKRTIVLLTGGVQRYIDLQYETSVVISGS